MKRWLLTNGGFRKGNPDAFDRQLALDSDTLLSFIKTSQPKLWARHQRNHPANSDTVFLDKFLFSKKLSSMLPYEAVGQIDLDDMIDLEYFRLEKTSEGAIKLEGSEEGFRSMTGDAGAGSE